MGVSKNSGNFEKDFKSYKRILMFFEIKKRDYDNSYSFKLFCFYFVNYYSWPFYIAFIKDSLTGTPPDYTKGSFIQVIFLMLVIRHHVLEMSHNNLKKFHRKSNQ